MDKHELKELKDAFEDMARDAEEVNEKLLNIVDGGEASFYLNSKIEKVRELIDGIEVENKLSEAFKTQLNT